MFWGCALGVLGLVVVRLVGGLLEVFSVCQVDWVVGVLWHIDGGALPCIVAGLDLWQLCARVVFDCIDSGRRRRCEYKHSLL